jgi:hypothetical protein
MFDDPIIQNLDRMPDEKLMSEKHLAFLMDVSVSKLQKDRLVGNPPPFVKMRGAVRYRVGDYRAFVKSNTVKSTSEADGLRTYYAGFEDGMAYVRIGSTIYGFIETLDRDVDEVMTGSLASFRAMGYKIAEGLG